MAHSKLLLAAAPLACSFLAVPAQAQDRTEDRATATLLVGASSTAASESLTAQGWTLSRHASTDTRTWSDWVDAGSVRKMSLEQLDGRVIAATDDKIFASAADRPPDEEHASAD